MTAKQYLKQARYLDETINTKLKEITSLHALATKAAATLSLAAGHSGEARKMEEIIVKIVMLENEVDAAVDQLVSLKNDISIAIMMVPDDECRLLLQKRYLSFERWQDIAAEMHMAERNVYRVHEKALNMLKVPLSCQ